MVALVDCNNFYASCERLFKPELKGKPIIVLSNNDGCVIARSNEAKDLGITMGAVYRKGFMYQKVEVTATGLIPETEVQLNMFSHWNGPINDKLSKIMDQINGQYGRGTIRIATEGTTQKWAMRRRFLSPAYTTQWKDIIKTK